MSLSFWSRIRNDLVLSLLACSLLAPNAGVAANVDTQPSLLRDEWYSEGWDHLFYFADGTLLVAQITILNIGFGSHHAGVFGLLVTPDKQRTVIKQSRSNREWEFAEDHLKLQIAKNRLSGAPPKYRINLLQSRGEIDIRFEAQAEPWSLGNTLQLGADYQYLSFTVPFLRADARARFFAEQEPEAADWLTFKDGRGFAVRYVNSTGLHDLIRNSTRIVSLSDSAMRPVFYTSRDEQGGLQTYLGLFENGSLIHQAKNFTLDIETKRETADSDERDMPHRMEVNAAEQDFSLVGVIEIDQFLARVDPVDSLKPFVRAIVKLLNTPIQYRYLASYDLLYTKGQRQLKMQGLALMDHTVLRYQRRGASKPESAR